MSRAWALGGVLAAILVAAAAPARADDLSAARDHYRKGTKAFDLGFYDDAIKEYMAAYQAKDDPVLLYNLAQAHRLANHPADALRFYRIYLTKLPHAENRPECEAKIAELTKVLDQQRKAQEMPPNQPLQPSPGVGAATEPHAEPKAEPKPEPKPEPPPAAAAPAIVAAPAPAPEVDAHAGRTKKIAGGALLGVGAAAIVGGIACGALAKSTSDDVTQASRSGQRWDPSKDSAGHTYDTLTGVFLGVGGVAVVAGAVVTALGFRESRHHVALVPAVSPHAVGATLELVR